MLQTSLPETMVGRAFGFYSVLMYGANVIGLVVFGAVAALGVSLQVLFWLAAAGVVASALAGTAWLRASGGPEGRLRQASRMR
ncbi:MAG: hypothetical protein ACYDH5_17200 [Acidimicrobiales bacterium]